MRQRWLHFSSLECPMKKLFDLFYDKQINTSKNAVACDGHEILSILCIEARLKLRVLERCILHFPAAITSSLLQLCMRL
jgi:hypothetical protein